MGAAIIEWETKQKKKKMEVKIAFLAERSAEARHIEARANERQIMDRHLTYGKTVYNRKDIDKIVSTLLLSYSKHLLALF